MVRQSRALTSATPDEPAPQRTSDAAAPPKQRGPERETPQQREVERHRQATKALTAKALQASRQLQQKELLKRLQSAEVLDKAMLFAALLMLMMFPFMIVMSASVGRDFSTSLSQRMGLNSRASHIVSDLFAHGASSSGGSTASWSVLLLFGVVAVAGALQRLYEDLYGLPPIGGLRAIARRLVWFGSFLLTFVGIGALAHVMRGRAVLAAVWFCCLVGFFWWTLHWLLSDRVSWRRLLPSAVFTALFYIGLGIFSAIYFSNTVESNYKSYGPIGAVLGMMSWLVAVAVVLILGSVCGLVWDKSGLSVRQVVRALGRFVRRRPATRH